jgi:hypothetical protein
MSLGKTVTKPAEYGVTTMRAKLRKGYERVNLPEIQPDVLRQVSVPLLSELVSWLGARRPLLAAPKSRLSPSFYARFNTLLLGIDQMLSQWNRQLVSGAIVPSCQQNAELYDHFRFEMKTYLSNQINMMEAEKLLENGTVPRPAANDPTPMRVAKALDSLDDLIGRTPIDGRPASWLF